MSYLLIQQNDPIPYGVWVTSHCAPWLTEDYEAIPKQELTNSRLISFALDSVATAWGVKIEDIKRRNRSPRTVEMRLAVMRLVRDVRKVAYVEIAEALGLKNHATVKNGLTKCANWISIYPSYARKVKAAGDLLGRKVRGLR